MLWQARTALRSLIRSARRRGRWLVLFGVTISLVLYASWLDAEIIGTAPITRFADVISVPSRPKRAARPQRPLGLDAKNFSWDFIPDALGVPVLRLLESGMPYDHDYAAVRECLRGRHIVFLGDSLTRYQYLNLVRKWSGSMRFDGVS